MAGFFVVTENNNYAIETFSLTKIFCDWWGRNKVVAVDDLSLKVRHNEVFGLLGPNGSGKTTTIKVLLSLLHQTKGRAVVLGGNSSDPKINARIGFLPEESYLYKYLSARETLDFYGRLFGLSRRVRRERSDALLEMVGLESMANRAVGTFSKGMARRIGLAQALINDPDLLILDEPTTGLDPIGTRQIKDLIVQLAKRGKTILLCSHLLADVEDVCDRISILYGGRVQKEGKVRELLQHSDRSQITASSLSSDAISRIEQIISSETKDYEISSPMERLESYFVRIIEEAQQQATPTSGAVSTRSISDFLAAGAGAESILDKLVTAEVSEEAAALESVSAEEVAVVEVRADDELLRGLTEAQEPVETEEVIAVKPEKQGAVEVESDEESGVDILRELTHGAEDEKRSGDCEDA